MNRELPSRHGCAVNQHFLAPPIHTTHAGCRSETRPLHNVSPASRLLSGSGLYLCCGITYGGPNTATGRNALGKLLHEGCRIVTLLPGSLVGNASLV
jgi:hypothetical protein